MKERRTALAAKVDQRVAVRAVAARSAVGRRGMLLLAVRFCGGGRVADHCWLQGRDLIREGVVGPGDLFLADCTVVRYEGRDPNGLWVPRYGLAYPRDVVRLGPASLAEMVGELVDVFGWEAVAGVVERLHTGETA